jgi:hypothetical protein
MICAPSFRVQRIGEAASRTSPAATIHMNSASLQGIQVGLRQRAIAMVMFAAFAFGTALAAVKLSGIFKSFGRQKRTIASGMGTIEFFLEVAFGVHDKTPSEARNWPEGFFAVLE